MPGIDRGVIGFPYSHWYQINPSDVADLDPIPSAIWIGATGTLSVVDIDGNVMNIPGTPTIGIYYIRPRRLRATGTTATSIYALY